MRKIIAAAAVGVVLVAGQAVASNGAAQQLRAGDRVGASLGASDEFIGSFFPWIGNGGFFAGGGALGGALGGLASLALISAVAIPVVDEVVDNGDS